MEEMEIMTQLSKLQYRVVPCLNIHSRNYEIIIEPWDFKFNHRKTGRTKKTGFIFSQQEVNQKGNSPYQIKLRETQLKLINHLTNKKIAS